jgi:uncharacterized protein YdiU (UPF0061 family)
MSIAGETIDYGPCAFMDTYHPATVFSSIDHQGRYAYANQPRIALWNLTRLAETLLPLISEDQEDAVAQVQESLGAFGAAFAASFYGGMRRKLGLMTEREEDGPLAEDLLGVLAEGGADFTLFFRRLADATDATGEAGVASLFSDPAAFYAWLPRWRQRLGEEPQDAATRQAAMRAVNPAFIPRNHRVEAVIQAAIRNEDFGPFEELLTVLSKPYEDQPAYARYADPPRPEERVERTFCGT